MTYKDRNNKAIASVEGRLTGKSKEGNFQGDGNALDLD